MTSVMERHYYRSDIMAHESAPMHIKLSQILSNEDEDMLPILFRLYMSMESMIISDDAGVIYEETATDLEAKKLIRVPRSYTSMWSTLVTEVLNDMDVPEDEQDSILRKVVQAFPEDHHELPVVVVVVDIYEVTFQRHRRLKLIPATRFR